MFGDTFTGKKIDLTDMICHFVCIMQALYWLMLPKLMREEKVEDVMTITQIIFLLQFFPKLYHSFYLMRGVRKVTGYIFGTAWWGLILNLIAYFLASHVRKCLQLTSSIS